MRPTPVHYVGLGILLWMLSFWFFPVPFLLSALPNYGLLVCAICTWILQPFPRWLIMGGSFCAGLSIALGATSLALGGGGVLALLFGGLWAWYFGWGPGRYLW